MELFWSSVKKIIPQKQNRGSKILYVSKFRENCMIFEIILQEKPPVFSFKGNKPPEFTLPGALTVLFPTRAAILSESLPPSIAIPREFIVSHMALQASTMVAPSPGSLAGHIQLPLHFTSYRNTNKFIHP